MEVSNALYKFFINIFIIGRYISQDTFNKSYFELYFFYLLYFNYASLE